MRDRGGKSVYCIYTNDIIWMGLQRNFFLDSLLKGIYYESFIQTFSSTSHS